VATLELDRVRAILLALPEVTERLSHGATCFFVRDKRPLCYFHDHHNNDRVSLWCPAPPGVQEALVASEPKRFFKPPTSASGTFSDWLGIFVDTSGDDAVDLMTRSLRVSPTGTLGMGPAQPRTCALGYPMAVVRARPLSSAQLSCCLGWLDQSNGQARRS